MAENVSNTNNPQDHGQPEASSDSSIPRKPWIKPAGTVEQVREVTARSPGGVRLDGGGSGSCLS